MHCGGVDVGIADRSYSGHEPFASPLSDLHPDSTALIEGAPIVTT